MLLGQTYLQADNISWMRSSQAVRWCETFDDVFKAPTGSTWVYPCSCPFNLTIYGRRKGYEIGQHPAGGEEVA